MLRIVCYMTMELVILYLMFVGASFAIVDEGNISVTLVHTCSYTQPEAKQHCESACDGCRLVDIESQAELNRVKAYDAYTGNVDLWTGAELIGGKWVWSHSNTDATINPAPVWFTTVISGGQYCIRIHAYYSDTSCSAKNGYLCEGDFSNPCEPDPCPPGDSCYTINFKAVCSGQSSDITGEPCRTDCPSLPSHVNHGSVQLTTASRSVHSTVTYQCDSGYIPTSGHLVRTCQSDGTWTGATPTCEDNANFYVKDATEAVQSQDLVLMQPTRSRLSCAVMCEQNGANSFTFDVSTRSCFIYKDQSGQYDIKYTRT